jgi:hypothetical protein
VAKTKKAISDKHYTSISEVAAGQSVMSVFGKLVKNADIEPNVTGITHPTGSNESLQLAQVVGYTEHGQCVRLPEPQLVALPVPDGPADGCGWDPQLYVVWKNLPKNWVTLHLKATTKSLHSALTATSGSAGHYALATAAKPCLDLPNAISLVRSCSNVGDNVPLSTPLGQLFPSPTARNAFCQCVANGVPIDRSQIPCGATNTLQDVVDAIAC